MSYAHKEAFALMWYACVNRPPNLFAPHTRIQGCGYRERIWNSRDGVTPFGGVECPSCGRKGIDGGLMHVEWNADECRPDHKLALGQRFFRDGTAADAIIIIKRRIEISKKSPRPIPDDIAERLLQHARDQTGEWNKGWPMIDRYDRAMLHRDGRSQEY